MALQIIVQDTLSTLSNGKAARLLGEEGCALAEIENVKDMTIKEVLYQYPP